MHEPAKPATASVSGTAGSDQPVAWKDDATFGRGAVVLVTLNSPREKFLGAVMDISPAGIATRGIDLNSFEDFVRQIKTGEQVSPNAVFFPMHRVERIELDARNGEIPSMQERFEAKSGRSFRDVFSPMP